MKQQNLIGINLMKKIILLIIFTPSLLQATEVYEVGCSLDTYWSNMVIVPSSIKGKVNTENFKNEGKIGIDAIVFGNENKRSYSGNIDYELVGERMELKTNISSAIPTNVTEEEFEAFFGNFPLVTCSAS
jgi:hypothetical protein